MTPNLTEEIYYKVAQLIESSAQSKTALGLEDWMAILLGIMTALAEMAARVVAFFPANIQSEVQERVINSLMPHLTVGVPARVQELNRKGGPLRA